MARVFQKGSRAAVAFAHSKGVIHRDLKPDNIMIGDFGQVLLMDWGLAKVLDPTRVKAAAGMDGQSMIHTGVRKELAAAETESGHVLGTPQYMAPEQAHGAHDALDPRTDLYALGAILYHILTLRPPVDGPDPQAVLHKAACGEFVPPHEVIFRPASPPHLPHGKVPAALSAITMKAMALQQSGRYSTVPDFQAAIESYQAGTAGSGDGSGAMTRARLSVAQLLKLRK